MSENLNALPYDSYGLLEKVSKAYANTKDGSKDYIWKQLEQNLETQPKIESEGYIWYLQLDTFGILHRICIPDDSNWKAAKDNGGCYENLEENKIYIIKKNGRLQILHPTDCSN